MRGLEPDYSWRVKLGGPEEENPLDIPGKILNLHDRSRPRTPRMALKDGVVEELLKEEVGEGEHEEFSKTAEQIVDQNHSGTLNHSIVNFKDSSRMITHFRVAGNATNLSKDNSDNWFHPHNVDYSSEHLSLSQISDMWLQYAKSGPDAEDPEEWGSRQVSVFLDPEYARGLASETRSSIRPPELIYGEILKDEENPLNSITTYKDTLLPIEFTIAETEKENGEDFEYLDDATEIVSDAGEETARLKLQQDPEKILAGDYTGPAEYRSENVETVHEHLGLAGLAEKWLEMGTAVNRARDS